MSGNETQKQAVVYSQSPEANELFLKAREYIARSHPDTGGTLANAREAIKLYEQAVKAGPKFALAFLEMSRAWVSLGFSNPDGMSNKELLPHAKAKLTHSLDQYARAGWRRRASGERCNRVRAPRSRALIGLYTLFTDLSETARHDAWTADFEAELLAADRGSGAYVSFLGTDEDAALNATYPPATLARLAEVKRRYDPGNVFRSNLNIQPAPGGAFG